MMLSNALRTCVPIGMLAALAAFAGCLGERSGVPAVTMLSPEGANHQSMSYSPDGTRLAYWASGTGGFRLTVASADLRGPVTLDSGIITNTPLWSPDGSAVAYPAGTDIDVWLAEVDGGAPRRLTQSRGVEIPLQWHPHGDRLAYLATGQGGSVGVSVIGLSTGTETPMLAEPRPAVGLWSPDGSMIVYNVIDAGTYTVWLADSTGAVGSQLTTEGFEEIEEQPWSPDGSEILVVSRRTGTADIWAIPVNGDPPRQLTRDVRDDFHARWSPDGEWVLFRSERGRQTDLWVVPASGGTPRRVTDDVAEESGAQWVPGGTEIAFTTGVTVRGLWTHRLSDGSERRITPDSIRVGGYAVSPDRTEVVYQVDRGGGVSDLHVVPAAGGPPRVLVAGSSQNTAPRWSPDGSAVLFISNRAGNTDVWVVDAAGGEPRRLTEWQTDEMDAAWSADGSAVYFISSYEAAPFFDLWRVPVDGGEPTRLTRVGTLQGVQTSPRSADVLVRTVGGSEGQIGLGRLLPNGSLETVWDRTTVLGTIGQRDFTPSGDSLAVLVQGEGGGLRTVLVPMRGGEGRPILGSNEGVMEWSPDGSRLLYWSGLPNSDLFVMSLRGGTVHQLTDTPDDEGGAVWLADGESVLFYRSTTQQRIATVDVGALMAGGR